MGDALADDMKPGDTWALGTPPNPNWVGTVAGEMLEGEVEASGEGVV